MNKNWTSKGYRDKRLRVPFLGAEFTFSQSGSGPQVQFSKDPWWGSYHVCMWAGPHTRHTYPHTYTHTHTHTELSSSACACAVHDFTVSGAVHRTFLCIYWCRRINSQLRGQQGTWWDWKPNTHHLLHQPKHATHPKASMVPSWFLTFPFCLRDIFNTRNCGHEDGRLSPQVV